MPVCASLSLAMVRRLEKASRSDVWIEEVRKASKWEVVEEEEELGDGGVADEEGRRLPSLSHSNRTGRSPRRRPQIKRAREPAERLKKKVHPGRLK